MLHKSVSVLIKLSLNLLKPTWGLIALTAPPTPTLLLSRGRHHAAPHLLHLRAIQRWLGLHLTLCRVVGDDEPDVRITERAITASELVRELEEAKKKRKEDFDAFTSTKAGPCATARLTTPGGPSAHRESLRPSRKDSGMSFGIRQREGRRGQGGEEHIAPLPVAARFHPPTPEAKDLHAVEAKEVPPNHTPFVLRFGTSADRARRCRWGEGPAPVCPLAGCHLLPVDRPSC
jgi:hypothetical protein